MLVAQKRVYGVSVVIAENPTDIPLTCSDVRAPQDWCAGQWERWAGPRMPLTSPGCLTSTLVGEIRWILGDYYPDP
ncbi:hypothetical protein GCM10010404_75560 [Nonomuraea africana]